MQFFKRLLFFFLLGILAISACRKDPLDTNPDHALEFSKDTVLFDTVFTTLGSTTQQLRVYNNHDRRIVISEMFLARGANSKFRLNVDGDPGWKHQEVEIPANDSIYVFVEVTLDPNNANNPMVVTDSIIFSTNGNMQDVDLVAWGQDAYFHGDPHFFAFEIDGCQNGQVTWTNDKPHVVYGYALVDTNCTLYIEPCTQVHIHRNSGIVALNGATLKIDGEPNCEVVIQGDRLEMAYDDIPGQWDRLWCFPGSVDNEIDYAIIKNGNVGIQSDSANVQITNTQILNMAGAGIFGQTATIDASNCVIADAAQFLAALTLGGNYTFRHCTFANYYSFANRQTPSILLNNWYEFDGTTYIFDLQNAYFGNCIIYGNEENEIGLDKNDGAAFNYQFNHSLIKIDPETPTPAGANYVGIIKNQDPEFVDRNEWNYRLDTLSPAQDRGSYDNVLNPYPIMSDIEGKGRKLNPDLGAYERWE